MASFPVFFVGLDAGGIDSLSHIFNSLYETLKILRRHFIISNGCSLNSVSASKVQFSQYGQHKGLE